MWREIEDIKDTMKITSLKQKLNWNVLDTTEVKISELEGIAKEILQNESEKKILKIILCNIKQSNISIWGLRKRESRKIFKETKAEIFSNLQKLYPKQSQPKENHMNVYHNENEESQW